MGTLGHPQEASTPSVPQGLSICPVLAMCGRGEPRRVSLRMIPVSGHSNRVTRRIHKRGLRVWAQGSHCGTRRWVQRGGISLEQAWGRVRGPCDGVETRKQPKCGPWHCFSTPNGHCFAEILISPAPRAFTRPNSWEARAKGGCAARSQKLGG